MRIAVGCPISNRGWIVDRWFSHVQRAFKNVDIEPVYLFVYGESQDDTLAKITSLPCEKKIILAGEEPPEWGAKRDWTPTRLDHMVHLRNTLLKAVRDESPRYFLSLDSDILIDQSLIWHFMTYKWPTNEWHAIGGKCYMTPPPGKDAPSYSKKGNYSRIVRNDSVGSFEVNAIMAIKWMTPAAYCIDYSYHPDGEDIGWSNNVRKCGYKLKWMGNVTNKHVMSPEWLDKVDPRVGW